MRSISRDSWSFVVAVLGAAAVLTASRPAAALDPQCLTSPVALPNLSGPPVWFDPSPATSTWRAELNDPRWSGAPLFNLCDNAELDSCALGSAEAQVRGLIDGATLYMQVLNVADDTQTSDDSVFVGIGLRGLAGARMVKITLDTITSPISTLPTVHDATPPTPNSAGTIFWNQATNASGASAWATTLTQGLPPAVSPAMRSWLEDVATWTNSLGGPAGTKWAVTFAVDLSQFGYTAPITDTIPLFFGTRHTPSVGAAVPLPNITTDTVSGTDTIVPGNKANWALFSPPAAGCTGGITLSNTNIGVWDGTTLGNQVGVCPATGPQPAGCPHNTTFRALPENVPPGSQVYTRMRLANFGSVYNDWPNAPWDDIPGAGNPLTDATVASGWTFTPADATGQAVADFTCNRGSSTYCPILSNVPAQTDQCLLVELGAPPSTNLKFENKAVYRNLWFEELSTLDQKATISIKGLQKATGLAVDRDVYLYVQKVNMPAHTTQPMELDERALQLVRSYAEHRPPHPPYLGGNEKGKQRPQLAAAKNAPTPPNVLKFVRAVATEEGNGPSPLSVPTLSSDDALSLIWPSYKIHVYYDTGRKEHFGGADRIVLAPMVPFGYYLNHQGTFFGFSDALSGLNGVVLEPLGHDWYRVHVKNEGYAQVRTVITAEESPKGPDGKSCCCEKMPPVKVVLQPHCYCALPGASGDSKNTWLAGLVLAGFCLRRLARRKGRQATH
ncbi:MAG TPA: hypothetical protein VMI54_08025 [Polyangiaceae bacterium]|nr:hypothetical protein [Polyangiaceae bacterium]